MDQHRATAAFQRHDHMRNGMIPFPALLDVVQKLTGAKTADDQLKALLRQQFYVDGEGRVRYADFLSWVYQVEEERAAVAAVRHPGDKEHGHLFDGLLFSSQEEAPSLACEVLDGVAVISLGSQREDERLPWGTKAAEHCLSPALLSGLFGALERAQRDATIQVIVVTALGEHWSNGVDRFWLDSHPKLEEALLQATELLFALVLKFPKPTVAALNGHALGAGAALALAFDVRVMNREHGLLAMPSSEVGIAHSTGVTALAAAKLPFALRHEFIVFGQSYTAEALLQHSVVSAAVPAADVLRVAIEHAGELKVAAPHPAVATQSKGILYRRVIDALERKPEPAVAQPHVTNLGNEAMRAAMPQSVATRSFVEPSQGARARVAEGPLVEAPCGGGGLGPSLEQGANENSGGVKLSGDLLAETQETEAPTMQEGTEEVEAHTVQTSAQESGLENGLLASAAMTPGSTPARGVQSLDAAVPQSRLDAEPPTLPLPEAPEGSPVPETNTVVQPAKAQAHDQKAEVTESAQMIEPSPAVRDSNAQPSPPGAEPPESTWEAHEPTPTERAQPAEALPDIMINPTDSAQEPKAATTAERTQEEMVPPPLARMPESDWEVVPIPEPAKASQSIPATGGKEASLGKETDSTPEIEVHGVAARALDAARETGAELEKTSGSDGQGRQADEVSAPVAAAPGDPSCQGALSPAAERSAKVNQEKQPLRVKPEEPERDNPRATSRLKEASYQQLEAVWEELQEGSAVLIKGSWLVVQAEGGAVLPRRQDLPLGAAWTAEELRKESERTDGCQPPNLIAVSYRWLAKEHPDPEGTQLRRLAAVLKLSHADPERGNDTAVFIDWCSLFQEKRSGQETNAFEQALRHIGLWYGHLLIDVVLLTAVPTHLVQYHDAGWPTFESSVCQLTTRCTGSDGLLDIGRLYTNSATVTAADWTQLCQLCAVARSPPLVPEAFETLVKSKTFSEGSDQDLVVRKYEETFAELIPCTHRVQWQCLGWEASHSDAIATVLSRCSELRVLDLSSNSLGNSGTACVVGVLSSCPELRVLALRRVGIDAEAVQSLAAALHNSKIQELHLTGNSLGDDGAAAVASAGRALRHLDLGENGLGEGGASALAEAIPLCTVLSDLDLQGNEISPSGQEALRKAWRSAGKVYDHLQLDGGTVVCEVSMDEIVGHVKSLGVHDRRQQASEALRMLVSGGDTALQTAIADVGAVPSLVDLLRDKDVGVREQAAGALRNLAYGNANLKNAIARAGAVPLLVKLLQEDTPVVRECAVGALRNLATGDAGRKTAIAHAGALPALVSCLKDSVPAVREQAAGVLRNLCVSDEALRSAIERIGAMPLLVELLTDKSAGVREHVAAALRGLALDAGRRTTIVKAGAVRAVVGLLGDDVLCVREQALAMLCNLAQGDPDAANSIVQAGALPRLVIFLNDDSVEMRKLTAWALGHLAAGSVDIRTAEYEPTLLRLTAADALSRRNASVQTNIEQVGAMPFLVRLLSDSTVAVRKEAAATLAVLAVGHRQNQASAVRAGAVPPLVNLLADANATIRGMAAGAIWALAGSLGEQKAKATRVLKTLLQDTSQEVRDMATRALSKL